MIGPVLGGQYPFHLALLAVAAAVLAALARRAGLVRWGRTVTVITTLCTLGALAIGGIQFRAAQNAGVDISLGQAFTELAYPAAKPDATKTYASPEGKPLQVDAYLPKKTPGKQVPAIVLAHAGGFHTFDKSDLRGTGRWLADHGVAVFASTTASPAPTGPPGTRPLRTSSLPCAGCRRKPTSTASTARGSRSGACRRAAPWR
ncbi:hypothetical protein OG741_00820 [Streptomyces sp. NBC_01410]